MENVKEIINNLMINKGLRRKRDVAAFFGVSPQALSFWIAKVEIPPKHLLNLSKQNIMINPSEPSSISSSPESQPTEDSKTVIDYLMRENVSLKRELKSLKAKIVELKTPSPKDNLLDKIVADSLLICGRVTDGIITDVDGKWKEILGYDDDQLVGHRYDRADLIHPDELKRVWHIQEKLKGTETITESRYCTIQRWKHGHTGDYVMLSMVWDVNVTENTAVVICKPIDRFIDGAGGLN